MKRHFIDVVVEFSADVERNLQSFHGTLEFQPVNFESLCGSNMRFCHDERNVNEDTSVNGF